MSVSVVCKNTCHTVGEGPHWEEKTQRLLYVDIMAGDMHIYDPATGKDVKKHFDDTVGFTIPCKSGGYMLGKGRQLCVAEWESDSIKVLGEVEQGTKNRFNDAKCDAAGRLWAGTMGPEIAPAEFPIGAGSLYSMEKDGSVTNKSPGYTISNGLAWTADNRIMYFVDSTPRQVYAFDFDVTTGALSNKRTVIDYKNHPSIPEHAFPDGMCIDTNGKLWVATFHGSKVIQFDPATGKEIGGVKIPAVRVTSCCFGGKNYDEMFVTCAVKGAGEAELKAHPDTGSVFKVTGLGAKGAPAFDFAG